MGSQGQRHKLPCPQHCIPKKALGKPSVFIDCHKKFSFQKKQSHKESLTLSPCQCSTWDMREFEGWGRTERSVPCSVKRIFCREFSYRNKTRILIYSSAKFEGKNIDPNTNVSLVYESRASSLVTVCLLGRILSIWYALSLNPCKNVSVLVSQCCVTKYLRTQGLQNTLAHLPVVQQRIGCIGCKLFHKPLLFSQQTEHGFLMASICLTTTARCLPISHELCKLRGQAQYQLQ